MQKFIGKQGKKAGVAPSVIMINPKFHYNVGAAQRACSCWGLKQLWVTGNRVDVTGHGKKGKPRLPREERMKGYKDVKVFNYDYPFDQMPDNAQPVAIELKPGSQSLENFEHPENAVYVFGPEDGSLDKVVLRHCHSLVQIPTRHCLNLAAAINVILWDRSKKIFDEYGYLPDELGLREHRGFIE